MDAMELLLSRESALKLEPPGPDRAALDAIFQSAVRAPDHGRMRPWRFVVIPEDKRGAVWRRDGRLHAPERARGDAEMLQRERDKAMRAPIIVVAAAHVEKGHKIPEVEQMAAAAAAAQNIMLAANAQGYGAMWKTGAPAYDATVKRALGSGGGRRHRGVHLPGKAGRRRHPGAAAGSGGICFGVGGSVEAASPARGAGEACAFSCSGRAPSRSAASGAAWSCAAPPD